MEKHLFATRSRELKSFEPLSFVTCLVTQREIDIGTCLKEHVLTDEACFVLYVDV